MEKAAGPSGGERHPAGTVFSEKRYSLDELTGISIPGVLNRNPAPSFADFPARVHNPRGPGPDQAAREVK